MDFNDVPSTSSCRNDDKLFDLDIYSDLIAAEVDQPDNEIQKKYEALLIENEELKRSNEEKEKQNQILMENISKLYKTAKNELYQKNLKLKSMKEHLDAVIFRRSSIHGNYSSTARSGTGNFNLNKNNRSCKEEIFNSNIDKLEYNSQQQNDYKRINEKILLQKEKSSINTPIVLNSSSETLMHYYKDQINSKTKKQQETCDKRSKTNKTLEFSDHKIGRNSIKNSQNNVVRSKEPYRKVNRTNMKDNNIKHVRKIVDVNNLKNRNDSHRPQLTRFNCHKSDVVRKAEAIKRKIRRNSVSPRKNYETKCFSPKAKRAMKRKEIEDGEIISDSDDRRERNDVGRKVRKFDIDAKKVVNERDDFLDQLERNKMKMMERREKVLKSKALEEMDFKDKKFR